MAARDELAKLTPAERPSYKAATVLSAIRARKPAGQLSVERNGLTLVFDADPELIRDKTGAVIGIDATIRAFRDGNELKVDPHRVCVNPPILVEDGFTETEVDDRRGKRIVRIPTYREDPWQAYLDWLFDSVETTPNPDGWRTRGTVTTVYAGTGDGGIESHNLTFSTAISGSNLVVNTTGTALWCGTTIGGDYYVQQLFFGFDTSAIADTDTVSDATFSLWANTGNSSREMVFRGWTFDWSSGGLTTADWRTATQLQALTELFSYAKTSAIGTTAYTDFTNTGTALASAINKTGTTYILVSDDLNETPTAPLASSNDVEFRMADYSGTTSDPKLTITHAAGGTNYNSSVAGAFSATAVITKKGLKPLAGAHSMAATVAKKAITSKSGSVGVVTGVATKKAIKSFSGAISPLSATVTWLPIKYLTGSISSSATIVKATAKGLSGISGDIAATVSKMTLRSLTGIAGGLSATITPVKVAILSLAGTMGALSGDIVKSVLKPLAGPVGVSGDVIKSTLKALSGVTALAGTIVKMTSRALSGATGGLTAALAGAKLVAIALAGATGSLSAIVTKSTLRPLGGTITSAGEMVRQTIKSITGAAGAIAAVLTPALVGGLYQVVGGAITASGTVVKLTKTTLSGAYSMTAELYKGMVAAFSGNFSATGGASKRIAVVRTGVTDAVSGTVARATTFVLIASGSIATLTSSIQRRINKSLSGAITNIFAFAGKPYKLAFSGAFTLSGFMQFNSVTRRAKMKAGLVVKSVTSMIAGRAKR